MCLEIKLYQEEKNELMRSYNEQLLLAAARGYRQQIEDYLECGADIDARSRGKGETPLMLAVKYKQLAIVQLLLKRGANVHARNKVNQGILALAVLNGCQKSLVSLLRQYGACFDNEWEEAAYEGDLEQLKQLRSLEGETSKQCKGHSMALHYAAAGGQQEVLVQ